MKNRTGDARGKSVAGRCEANIERLQDDAYPVDCPDTDAWAGTVAGIGRSFGETILGDGIPRGTGPAFGDART